MPIQRVKHCEDCGEVIAVWPDCEWHSWIRLKRCADCAAAAKRIQTTQSKRRTRQIRRIENARARVEEEAARVARENLALQYQRNALLRQDIVSRGGRVDWAERRCM